MAKRRIRKKVRDAVLAESNHQCSVCGARKFLQVHHLLPISLGGNNSAENLIVLCPTCHLSVDRSGINPGVLSDIKRNWTKRHILGREEVTNLNKRIRESHHERTAQWSAFGAFAHELAHWTLSLTKYKDFDTHIERIASEIAATSSEDHFLRYTLKPLFDALGFQGVTVLHHTGRPERGKDIVFYDRDRLGGLTFYAVVASAKRIHANSAKTHDAGHYQKIIDQISKCYLFPYKDPNLKASFFIDKVVVASASTITEEAMEAFNQWETDNRRHLIFLSGPDIAGMRLKLSVESSSHQA